MTRQPQAHPLLQLAYLPLALLSVLLAGSCRDPNVPDLNNGAINDLLTNPTPVQIANAAQGLLVGARLNIAEYNGYVSELGLFGRESYIFDPGDNRFETELLGPGPLDPGGPRFGGNLWVARFSNIKAANLLLTALKVPYTKPDSLTTAEKEAARGFAQTIQALDFLEVINTRDTIGAPIAVDLPIDSLAPIVPRDQVFNHIVRLLDSAQTHLQNGGGDFPFRLPSGFAGFTTPAKFLQFNRALKARVDVYMGVIFTCAACYTDAVTLLSTAGVTFLDTTAALDVGAYHTFATGSGDLTNGLFDPTPAKLYAHPSLRDSAETQASASALDRRFLAKVDPVTLRVYGRHSSSWGFTRYASPVAPVPILRNEELILLLAEANLGLNNLTEAAKYINFIRRTSGGLTVIANLDLQTSDSVLSVLLKEKRYSLLFEGGHHWLDMRHHGRLNTMPNQTGDNIYLLMPVPLDECLPRPAGSRGCP